MGPGWIAASVAPTPHAGSAGAGLKAGATSKALASYFVDIILQVPSIYYSIVNCQGTYLCMGRRAASSRGGVWSRRKIKLRPLYETDALFQSLDTVGQLADLGVKL